MKANVEVVEINGVKYVPQDSINYIQDAEKLDGMKYVIVRTYSAGVFAGYLKSMDNKNVVLVNARRIWYWDGAATLSQLATDGVSKPENCKFPCVVDSVDLTEAIEIIDCTEKAKVSIAGVVIWKS